MDSFFAAADNLDNLLDEFEESEEVQQVPQKQKQVTILQEETSHKHGNLGTSGTNQLEKYSNENLEYLHKSDTETNNLSGELKSSEPVFLIQEESANRNVGDVPANGSTFNIANDAQQSPTESMDIGFQTNNPHGAVILNGKVEVPQQSPFTDVENLGSSKSAEHVPGPTDANSPLSMPKVIENLNSDEPLQSNSELLMELFGAVPAPKTDSFVEQTLPVPNAVFSPLNPFNDVYNQVGLEIVPSVSNEGSNLKNSKSGSLFNQSNPFYNLNTDAQSSGVNAGAENNNGNSKTATYAVFSSQPMSTLDDPTHSIVGAATGTKVKDDPMQNLSSNTGNASLDEEMPVTSQEDMLAIGKPSSENVNSSESSDSPAFLRNTILASSTAPEMPVASQEEDVPGIGKRSSENVDSSDSCNSPAFLRNTILASSTAPEMPVASQEEDVPAIGKQSYENVDSSESCNSPAFLQNTILASSTTQEKQERSSVGFMKDVAVSQEEFDKFWEDMEKAEEDSHAMPAIEEEQGQGNLQILPADVKPGPAHVPHKVESSTDGQWDVTVVEAPTSVEEDDAVIISSLPADSLVSESEFEQFLASEIIETAPEVNVTPATPVQPAMETSPVIIPVVSTPSTHEGSPTFPLDIPSQETAEVSSGNHQDTLHSESNNRLSLNIAEISRVDTEGTEPDPTYPATPPPPYTEEMHANYERSLSPTQQVDRPSQPVSEPTQRGGDEGERVEDDFSVLPSSILEMITRPGETKPTWVPDQDAPQCNNCALKFTFTRRRHHCRACGRVFCAACCSERAPLKYMEYKEARVCSMCSLAIKQADALALMSQRTAQSRSQALAPRPPQNAETAVEASMDVAVPPAENPPQPAVEAVEERQTPSTEVSPNQEQPVSQDAPSTSYSTQEDMEVEGAMARMPGSKSVRFSDGTRPTHPDGVPTTPPPPSRVNRVRKKHSQPKDATSHEAPELPPVIIAHGENGAYAVKENPNSDVVMGLLESGDQNPQSFVLNPNLIVHIKFVTYAGHQCWCYWSEGMDSVGQREVVLLLERQGLGDRQISKDAFSFYTCIFDRARKGKIFNTTDFMPRTMLGVEDSEEIFGLTENLGFLFVQATSQTLDGLECLKKKVMLLADGYGNTQNSNLPIKSMLFALLVQKNEAPWATLFPMRLMLRLGVERKQYPCPLFSIRRRAPVYYELGHTILAILCDFRNFKYRVVSVPGLRVVVASSGSVGVHIPCNRFTDTIRIMNSSNESVLAIGTGTFGPKILPYEDSDGPCDSHLVCVQDQQDSNYHTEIMSMKGTNAINTGAAFVIFNGSLKSDGTHVAKCAVVEDGIMIQLLPEKMEELRASLKSMEDFKVHLGSNSPDPAEPTTSTAEPPSLEVKWVEDDVAFNIGMFSPVDGTPFEGVVGFNVQGRSEQRGRKHTLRWNQVFFLASTSNPIDMSRLAEQVANGCFLALTPVLHELVKHRQHKVAIRVTIHPDNVGYVAGSGLHDLPQACMNALDEQLIQTIHNAANSVAVEQEAVVIELLFSILLSRPAYRTA